LKTGLRITLLDRLLILKGHNLAHTGLYAAVAGPTEHRLSDRLVAAASGSTNTANSLVFASPGPLALTFGTF
ncbi:MAG: hypothetical protein PVG28_09375, partial [Desulfobacterales bacterium]